MCLDKATGKDTTRMLGNPVCEHWKGFGHLAARKKDIAIQIKEKV